MGLSGKSMIALSMDIAVRSVGHRQRTRTPLAPPPALLRSCTGSRHRRGNTRPRVRTHVLYWSLSTLSGGEIWGGRVARTRTVVLENAVPCPGERARRAANRRQARRPTPGGQAAWRGRSVDRSIGVPARHRKRHLWTVSAAQEIAAPGAAQAGGKGRAGAWVALSTVRRCAWAHLSR